MKIRLSILFLIVSSLVFQVYGQSTPSVSGIFPNLAMVANHSPRTEAGAGGLMPWANRLWVITYVAHMSPSGSGTGLYEINEKMELKKRPESIVGTYANRFIHASTHQLIIGPYVIDTLGNVRVIEGVKNYRLAATMAHLTEPNKKVYFLSMEGEFFEADVTTLESKQLFNLMKELDEPVGSKPHFKSGFTKHGRVVVTNNSYNEKDYSGAWSAGRLAEWDGATWKILEKTAFTEVWSAGSFGQPMIATGWDKASVLMNVYFPSTKEWKRYRLPKGSRTFDETSCTEWMRIREVETERALMDCHGLFYEIGYHTYGNQLWAIKPISSHLRIIPDFCSWRGMLVLGGNQATPMRFSSGIDNNPLAGQAQAGLWFGKTDDLWNFGKLQGEGGVWLNAEIKKGKPSDPFFTFNFNNKSLNLWHKSTADVKFTLEADVVGDGVYRTFQTITVKANESKSIDLKESFNPKWIRLVADKDCVGTAYFTFK
jgi:hypothetical protein